MRNKYTQFNKTPYESHMLVYDLIKNGSKVLDVGCAEGYFAKELQKKNCSVWGIEIDSYAAKKAKKFCKEVFVRDIDKINTLPLKKGFFDYILLLDIIEHLKDQLSLLKFIQLYLKKGGSIIISTPNIAFISIRLGLLTGHFDYQKMGIMDKTHLHFYTKTSLQEIIKNSGLVVDKIDVASGFSQITLCGKYLNHIPKYWQYNITKLWDTLLAYQFIALCSIKR